MNFIAHAIYEHTQDVDLSIEIFSGLIVEKSLVGLYSGNVPEYHLQAFVLERCIAHSLPTLHSHFKRLGVKLDMFTCEWIMTFFCGFFQRDSSLSLAVLDNVMIDGWQAVQRISIALLRFNEERLLQAKDLGQISAEINKLRSGEIPLNDLLLNASSEILSPDLE